MSERGSTHEEKEETKEKVREQKPDLESLRRLLDTIGFDTRFPAGKKEESFRRFAEEFIKKLKELGIDVSGVSVDDVAKAFELLYEVFSILEETRKAVTEGSSTQHLKDLLKKYEKWLDEVEKLGSRISGKARESVDEVAKVLGSIEHYLRHAKSLMEPLVIIRHKLTTSIATAYGVSEENVKLVITLYDTKDDRNDVSFIYSARNPLNDTVEYGEGTAVFNESYKLVRLVLSPKKAV